MNRIKIMLLSLVVLAAIGGVLAFKAKEQNFCIYKVVGTTCPLIAIAESVKITNSPLVQPIFFTLPCGGAPTRVSTTLCSLRITDVVLD